MTDFFKRTGIRPIINARDTHTRIGGSIMPAEVLEAMHEAASSFVVLEELQAKASDLIARATGAEAGIVTGGAAGGLLLGTAACVAGSNPANIEQLPSTAGLKNQVIMHRSHRNGYDHSVRAAGVEIVEVGFGHTTLEYQLENAINDKTAMIMYLMSPWATRGALSLRRTCQIAHNHGVPVLVDAAAMLPPATNLTAFIADGADLVTFSGGKGLKGPQSSGILAGRRDLIDAAAVNGSPNHSIGRTAKAAKEDIAGLMVAIELYLQRDHEADVAHWKSQANHILGKLGDFPGIDASYQHDQVEHLTPRVKLRIDQAETGIDAHELVVALEQGDPRVFLLEWPGPSSTPNSVTINTHTLQPGEEKVVADVVFQAIASKLNTRP